MELHKAPTSEQTGQRVPEAPSKIRRAFRRAASAALKGVTTLGVSLAFWAGAPGSPEIIQDARAEQSTRSGYSAQDLTTFIQQLSGDRESEDHPLYSTDPEELADSALRLGQLLELMHGRRPEQSHPMRAVYDLAVSSLGGGSDRTAFVLDEFLTDIISSIRQHMEGAEGFGAHASALRTLLERINEGMSPEMLREDSMYAPFLVVRNDINSILRLLRGVEAEPEIYAGDQSSTTDPLAIIGAPVFSEEPIHLLTDTDDVESIDPSAFSTRTLDAMFQNPDRSQEFVLELAESEALLHQHPNDSTGQRQAAEALYNLLSQIPESRDVWGDEHFNAAMDAFSRGDLRNGLMYLAGNPDFNRIYEQGLGFTIVSVTQRAVTPFHAYANLRIPFRENMGDWSGYLRGDRHVRGGEGYGWDVLSVDIGVLYDLIMLRGFRQEYNIERNAAGEVFVGTGDAESIDTFGHAIALRPSILMAAASDRARIPVEIELFFTLGWRYWEITQDVESGSDSNTVVIGQQGADGIFAGRWGTSLRFPGFEGERSRVRPERISFGAVELSPFANATFSATMLDTNRLRIMAFLTPEYMYSYMQGIHQHRVSTELRIPDISWQINRDWMLYGALAARYGLNIYQEYTDPQTEQLVPSDLSHTVDAALLIGFRTRRGFGVDVKAGYIMEFEGPEHLRLLGLGDTPGMPYAMVTGVVPLR